MRNLAEPGPRFRAAAPNHPEALGKKYFKKQRISKILPPLQLHQRESVVGLGIVVEQPASMQRDLAELAEKRMKGASELCIV